LLLWGFIDLSIISIQFARAFMVYRQSEYDQSYMVLYVVSRVDCILGIGMRLVRIYKNNHLDRYAYRIYDSDEMSCTYWKHAYVEK
jgi:hypothetical protein